MKWYTCCICGHCEREDLVPSWIIFGSSKKVVCIDCQIRIIEKNNENR